MKNSSHMIVAVAVCFVACFPNSAAGQGSDGTAAEASTSSSATGTAPVISPPQRPKAITPEQLVALEQLAEDPQFSVSPETRAAYSPEVARKIDRLSGPGFYAGYGTTLLIFLIAAAPL